ncbi:MAG TPA: O-antigen ligase family protein [Candidatus Baltobacteraceae bacterium]|nr:O-antigen ligase family protein [Candidatus Baltobacteraceae bacterium]
MQYHPVIDSFATIPILSPPVALSFIALFALAAFLTIRRPSYGLALLLFAIPFDAAHAVAGTTIGIPKMLLLGVIVGMLSRPAAWKALATGLPLRVLAGFGIMLLPIVIGGLGAAHHVPVAREFLKWIEYACFFAVGVATYESDRNDRLIVAAWIASIACVCASALIQEFIGAPWGIYFGAGIAPRISGAIEGPNQLAGYLESAVALLGAWNVTAPSRIKSALLAVVGLTLMLTFSRSGVVGTFVVALVVIAYSRRSWLRALGSLVGGSIAGACAAFAWSVVASRSLLLSVSSASPLRPTESTYAGGVGTRSELWRAALAMWRAHPFFGVGAGNYELELAQYGLPGVRTHSNSWYLQSLAEGGVAGLLATLVFLALVVTSLASRARSSPWALAALAATVGLAVHQIADYLVFYPKVAEPWIVLIALGVATPPSRCD